MVDASILRCCSSFFQAPPEGCKPDHAGSHKGENTRFRHRRTDHVLSMVRGVLIRTAHQPSGVRSLVTSGRPLG